MHASCSLATRASRRVALLQRQRQSHAAGTHASMLNYATLGSITIWFASMDADNYKYCTLYTMQILYVPCN